jgi:hypothetical protein
MFNTQDLKSRAQYISHATTKKILHNRPVFHQSQLPCHYDCTIRNLLQITVGELANLNRVSEDLDDLCFREPNRHLEVTAKLNVVNEMVKNKMAEARKMILCTEFGCYLCHPEEGLIYE